MLIKQSSQQIFGVSTFDGIKFPTDSVHVSRKIIRGHNYSLMSQCDGTTSVIYSVKLIINQVGAVVSRKAWPRSSVCFSIEEATEVKFWECFFEVTTQSHRRYSLSGGDRLFQTNRIHGCSLFFEIHTWSKIPEHHVKLPTVPLY